MSTEVVSISEMLPVLVHEGQRRVLPLMLLFAAIALTALVVGALWPKKYVSSTSVLVTESNIIKPLMEGRAFATGVSDRAGIAREVIFSRKIMDEIMQIAGWLDSKPSPVEQERIIEKIKNNTSINVQRESLIQITYADSDAERTFKVTKRLAELFIKESLETKERESREAFDFIASRVDEYHAKLTDAEEKLKIFRAERPDARPGTETDVNTRIGELRRQVESARMEMMEMSSKEGALVAQLSGESEITAVQTREGQYRSRLNDLQSELDKLLLNYTDSHPDVIRVRHQMEDLRNELKLEEQRTAARRASGQAGIADESMRSNPLYQELRSKLAEVRRNIGAAASRMNSSDAMLKQELDRGRRIAESESTLSELTRDYEVNRDIYQDLLKRRENARVSMDLDREQRGLTFRIQEPAMMPLQPSGLRFMHFGLAGLALALILPIGALFGFVRLDPRIRSVAQLERSIGVPVLASVPAFPTRQSRRRNQLRVATAILILLLVGAAYAVMLWLRLGRAL